MLIVIVVHDYSTSELMPPKLLQLRCRIRQPKDATVFICDNQTNARVAFLQQCAVSSVLVESARKH